jgi:hypothetical protein
MTVREGCALAEAQRIEVARAMTKKTRLMTFSARIMKVCLGSMRVSPLSQSV